MYTYYWTQSSFVKHILLRIHGSCPTTVRFLHSWAECVQEEVEAELQSPGRASSFGRPSSWEVPQSKPGSDARHFVWVT